MAGLRSAGMTVREIADAAGVHWSTVDRIVNRRLKRVSRITERLVLGVGVANSCVSSGV